MPASDFRLIDFVVLLTLPRRTDRQAEFTRHMQAAGIAHRIFTVHGLDMRQANVPEENKTALGDLACGQGHRQAVEIARLTKSKNVLVLEDDAIPYLGNLPMLHARVKAAMARQDWMTFNLGGCRANWRPATPAFASVELGKGLFEVRGMVTTHAVLYHERVFDDILIACPSKGEVMQSMRSMSLSNPRPYDQWLAGLGGMITADRPFFYQSGSCSDIVGMPHGYSVKQVIDETYESIRKAVERH